MKPLLHMVLAGLVSLAPATPIAVGGESILVDSAVLAAIQEVEVPAQEAGVLVEVAVAEGTLVKPGDLLARIDDADAQLDRSQAEIELQQARRNAENDVKIRVASAAADLAAAELRRAHEAQQRYQNSVSEAEVDHLRLAVEHATLQVEQSKYDLETAGLALRLHENAIQRAQRQIERRRIASPTTGRVVQVYRQQGEWVEPGQPVVRVLRLDRLRAVGFLDARHANHELAGRPVRLQVELPGEPDPVEFSGRVTFLHSEINPVSGQLDFWAEIDNPDLRLRPGQKATLRILE